MSKLLGALLLSGAFLCISLFGNVELNQRNLSEDTPSCDLKATPEKGVPPPEHVPWIFVITPTYGKIEQKADLTRLSQTLSLVPNLHWIVVEDRKHKSVMVHRLLQRSLVPAVTHLNVFTPKHNQSRGRGMEQRNAGLQYLRQNLTGAREAAAGVLYFADDDNAYDLRLFNQYIRNVRSVGVWAVGFAGGSLVECPIVNEYNQVVGWSTRYSKKRKFGTDMAGFAVHLGLIQKHKSARFHAKCKLSKYETCFLEQLDLDVKRDLQAFGLENKTNSVKEVMVWHTKTKNSGAGDGRKGFDEV